MRGMIGLLILAAVFWISCGQKTATQKDVSNPKEVQIARAQKAFAELEKEVGKPAKDLSLPAEKTPSISSTSHPKPKPKAYAHVPKRSVPKTKYPIVNGLPVWVSNPNYGGVLGGVGIAKKRPGMGYAEQKRLAKQIALADLAKQIEVIVKTETTSVKVNMDTQRLKYYKSKFESYSEHEVRSLLIKNAVIEDEWVDPQTGDLYVWVVIK